MRPLSPLAGQPRFIDADRCMLLDLASNDYLGLAHHPEVVEASQRAIAELGAGAGGSRLVSGTRPLHLQLERELAAWLGREKVLLFPSGFQANLAAITALADRRTLVLADRLVHHSLLSGVRTSQARLQRYRHNDLEDLSTRLSAARRACPQRRLLVLSESLFSMEGTSPDVAALVAVCSAHSAALVLDEAHALGVLGPGGRGLGYGHAGIALISGTFGKAFGSGGAFLTGDPLAMDWLLQSSGAFRYTTALAPALTAAALAALALLRGVAAPGAAPGERLLARSQRWRDALEAAGWPRPPGKGPILSLVVGGDIAAMDLQHQLEAAGLLVVAIRPPTVPDGTARLRVVVRQDLPDGSLRRLLQALGPAPCR
nr:aminotransferase class I/II-fold pyridoxal phosphate-dependent enzyme [Cyanobium sp. NIES-981]